MFSKTFDLINGVHPHEYKELSNTKKIESADVPNLAYIPVSQHIGKPAKIIVKAGDVVEEGQLIAEGDGFISANVHTSIPGKVVGVEEVYISMGRKVQAIVIQMEGYFHKSGKNMQLVDWFSLEKEKLLSIVRDAGIVGLGGATFPTHVKLSIPEGKSIDTLVINAAECEPFLTCDHRLLMDKSEELLEGVAIINKILDVPNVYIGIENNKGDAIRRLRALCENRYKFKIVPLHVKYPQGDEKQLIKALTGRVVPVETLPLEVGVVVVNTATTVAIRDAVVLSKPLIERVVTVTGHGIANPKNLKVKIGTPIGNVIEECGGLKDNVAKVVIGGPMMGFSQMDLKTPVTKGTSGILCLTDKECGGFKSGATCINCGRCIEACSFGLMPTVMNRFIQYKRYDDASRQGIMYCKECGACSWNCPAKIPLVQNFRLGKDFVRKLVLTKKSK